MADDFPSIEAYQTLSQLHDALAKSHAELVSKYAALQRERNELAGSPTKKRRSQGPSSCGRTLQRQDTFQEMKLKHGIWHVIRFEQSTFEHLQKLFFLLDTQQEGYITAASFGQDFMSDFVSQMGSWDNMKALFDADGNDHIDPDEFVEGFAKLCLQIQIETSQVAGKTIHEVVEWIGHTINQQLTVLVMKIFETVKDSLAQRSAYSKGSTNLTKEPIVASLQINDEIAQKLTTQFDQIDTKKKGFIVSADLPANLQAVWLTMKSYFDKDGDDKVDRGEYFKGFMDYVQQGSSGLGAVTIPIGQLLLELGETVNRSMGEKMFEFEQQINVMVASTR